MNKPTTEKALAFIAKKPTLLGTVCGDDYYEHPTMGDEAPLYIITPSGEVRRTEHWELPAADDVMRNY